MTSACHNPNVSVFLLRKSLVPSWTLFIQLYDQNLVTEAAFRRFSTKQKFKNLKIKKLKNLKNFVKRVEKHLFLITIFSKVAAWRAATSLKKRRRGNLRHF